MDLGINVNPAELAPPEKRSTVIPKGEYLLSIDKAEIKTSKKNANNKYLNIQCRVMSADYTNRVVFKMFNYKNDTVDENGVRFVERQALAELGELMRAANIPYPVNDDNFPGKIFRGGVVVRPAKGDYDESNDIVSFKSIDGDLPKDVSGKPIF